MLGASCFEGVFLAERILAVCRDTKHLGWLARQGKQS